MSITPPSQVETGSGLPDILQWIPPTWDQFVGNRRLKRFLQRLLLSVRKRVREGRADVSNKLRFLLIGPSRSGKTSMISFFARCIVCQRLDMATLNPCDGRCEACKERPELYGDLGIFANIRGPEQNVHVHFQVIDATMIEGPSDLRGMVRELREFDGIRIVYVDEVHRLVRREMDEILLKAMEQKGFIWIFSTANPEGLEDMFLGRLVNPSTELPTLPELEQWLVDRCEERRINWESEAVMRLAEKSNCIAGKALLTLAVAALDPEEGLTLELVENGY